VPVPAAGRFPAVGVPSPAGAGWTLPATHLDLFAPVADLGFGALPPELAAYPGRPAEVADGPGGFLAARDRPPAFLGAGPNGVDEDLDEETDDGALGRREHGSGEPWVSYTVTRAGWRKRVLRIRVHSDGAVPELVLVARPGTRPPATFGDGQALARLAPCDERVTRSLDVRLEGALLPWAIRLLAAPGGADDVEVVHPPADTLIVR
jgi:hypothetical protein